MRYKIFESVILKIELKGLSVCGYSANYPRIQDILSGNEEILILIQ